MRFLIIFAGLAILAGCATPSPATNEPTQRMTLGTVQKSIHKGMSQSAVAGALGAPNIVTRDDNGAETWIYDKMSSVASYGTSSAYGTILLIGGQTQSGHASTGQRTLTVIIKFDAHQKVASFSYNESSF